MTRRVERFTRGQPIRNLRKPLNRIVNRLNAGVSPAIGSVADPGFLGERILMLQIEALNASDLTCTIPGEVAPERFQYTVELPPIFTEASRGAVNYVYTDINNRVADGSENQQLTPEFIVGEIIPCAFVDDRQTGLWLFLGDGRMWAKV